MTDQAEREGPTVPKVAKTKKTNGTPAKAKPRDAESGKAKPVLAVATAPAHQRGRVETWWEVFKETYFTIDRRTLALTRICLGFFLLGDLFRRTPDWIHMFGDTGILPTTLILSKPQASGFSILHGFSSNWELWVLWAVMLVTFTCVLIGYKTKVAQVLSLLFVTSLNGRVLLIENGGYVVHNLLLLWTCFMPLGDRYSLDAMLTSMKRKRERTPQELNDRTDALEPFRLKPFTSLVCLVILVQLSAVYYFNKIHKTGPAWSFQQATAVHFVMYVDRMVNPIIADVRTHIPFFVFQQMTRAVLFSEMVLAYLFLSPLGKLWTRRVAIILVNFLHIGFGSTFVLGPFAWALCVFATLLFQKEDWDTTVKWMRRERRRRTVLYNPTSGAALFFCRVVKRLDRYALLGFDIADENERKAGIVVERPDGSQVTGRVAFAEILAAVPVGAFFAPLFTAKPLTRWVVGGGFAMVVAAGIAAPYAIGPLVGVIVGAVFALPIIYAAPFAEWAMQPGRWSKFFGMKVGDDKPEVDPSAVPARTPLRFTGSFLRELICFAMMVGAINQALTELWVTRTGWSTFIASLNKNERQHPDPLDAHGEPRTGFALSLENGYDGFKYEAFKAIKWAYPEKLCGPLTIQPECTQILAHKLRFLQGWFMFSPNPVMDDGTIIVDAVTVDGRHIDPFWDTPTNYDLIHAKSYGYNQIWSDYFNRMHLPGNRNYRDPMIDYMRRLPERSGNPNDAIVSGEVYWVHDMNPKWKTTDSWAEGRDLLFTFGQDGGAKEPVKPATPAAAQ